MRSVSPVSRGLRRSLTLLRAFLVASAVVLVIGAVVLSSFLADNLRDRALADTASDVSVYVNAVLSPRLVKGGRISASPLALSRLRETTRFPDDVTGVSILSRQGRLLWSTTRRDRGARLALTSERRGALRGRTSAELVDGPKRRSLVVTTPIRLGKGRPVGAYEISLDPSALEADITSDTRAIWLVVGAVFGTLWLVLVIFVSGASLRMRQQNDDLHVRSSELVHSAQELERSLLDTIETLNAAVEARDPYTAGHSQRVRRVALALGRELGLSPLRLGSLSTAAVFHDVGKIAIPDAILTKTEPLTPAEAAVMREHAARGAEIVEKLSSMRTAVPAIRHHHERWNGLGYPDGLASDDIPLEATIVALADAWDAMTTERPYARSLSINEAFIQVRAGRGKQFNPAVVDAFFTVAKRQPAEILPPEEASQAVVAV